MAAFQLWFYHNCPVSQRLPGVKMFFDNINLTSCRVVKIASSVINVSGKSR